MRVDASWWHIIDAQRSLTWCGLFLSQGSERRSFSETPEGRRCETCLGRFDDTFGLPRRSLAGRIGLAGFVQPMTCRPTGSP